MARMTTERMQQLMADCDKYQLRLANDPTVLGPKYLQDMIATCRNYTNSVVLILGEIRRAKMEIDFDLRRKDTAFKIAADELLAKNPVVRNLPNIKDRQSQINIILKDEHREVMTLQNDLLDLEHIEDFVQVRYRELKDTMKEIYTQRGLIRDEIQTGTMYGDERSTAMGGPASLEAAYTPGHSTKMEGVDEDEIERMLQQSNGAEEAPAAEVQETTTTPTVTTAEPVTELAPPAAAAPAKPKSEEEEIRDFLGTESSAPVVSMTAQVAAAVSSSVVDDDLTELLANI